MRALFFLLLALLSAPASVFAADAPISNVLRATLKLPDDKPLPPADAVLEMTLEDNTNFSGEHPVLGTVRAPWAGRSLIVGVGFDPQQISPRRLYGLHAKLSSGDQLLYVTRERPTC